jgi:gamma-aminobutyric acid type B receptor
LDDALKKENYDIDNKRYPEGYQEAPLAYDAVWAVALGNLQSFRMFANLMLTLISAFNKTMDKLKYSRKSLKNFTYTDKETADDIYSSINSTQFLGVSVI